jgi:hypothetical protein
MNSILSDINDGVHVPRAHDYAHDPFLPKSFFYLLGLLRKLLQAM